MSFYNATATASTTGALDQGVGVDLTGAKLPARVTALLGRLADLDVAVQVKLAATDFGLNNFYVVGAKPGGETPGIMAAAAGEACHPDKVVALEKALLEFAAARTRLAFNHGPLERVQEIAPPGYLRTYYEAFGGGSEEARALAAMQDWLKLEPKTLRDRLRWVYGVRRKVPWNDLPHAQSADPLTDAAARLAGFELLYLALASPAAQEQGVTAVKAVVPGARGRNGKLRPSGRAQSAPLVRASKSVRWTGRASGRSCARAVDRLRTKPSSVLPRGSP